ncbi:unnamed protein product [Trifolium pratense]|uniref:Uncharacterized protein n=1 Tax=Trifolium pratense TaxID=57577 RepID=A0ACB0JJV4_TRIPR|nr:unnamed protein product [Trifolium pratense]
MDGEEITGKKDRDGRRRNHRREGKRRRNHRRQGQRWTAKKSPTNMDGEEITGEKDRETSFTGPAKIPADEIHHG